MASKRTFFLPATTGAALALLVTACGDDVTDPGALLASAEAEAIVRSAAALPSLGTLIEVFEPAGDADRATLLQAHELWTAGTAADDERGRAQRRVAVRHASPILARTVPGEEWVEVRERLDRWIGTADLMLEHLRLPEVDDRIAAARRYLQRADAATVAEGRPTSCSLPPPSWWRRRPLSWRVVWPRTPMRPWPGRIGRRPYSRSPAWSERAG